MTIFLDTSVLVPVFYEDHVHHGSSLRVFRGAVRNDAYCSAHSLAELYATTTRLPGRFRLAADQAALIVSSVVERITPISLSAKEYARAIERAASSGFTGGTIYDALIVACAIKADASVLYTWNVRHFERIDHGTARVRMPA